MDLKAEFEKNDDHYLEDHESITGRADLHAFNLLERLVPGKGDIITSAEHDVFYLGIDVEELAKVATPEDITTLVRCGVMYDGELDCLSMFA